MDRQSLIDGFARVGLGSAAWWVFLRVLDSGGVAYVNTRDAGRRLGLSHVAIVQAIRSLVTRGIVRRDGAALALVSDLATWPVSPRVRSEVVPGNTTLPPPGNDTLPPPGNVSLPPGNTTLPPPGNDTLPPGNDTLPPPGNTTLPPGNDTLPPSRVRAELRERGSEREKEIFLSDSEPGPRGPDGLAPVATVNGPDDRPHPIEGTVNDPAEVRRVARLAEDLFPLLEFGSRVEGYRTLWPMAWIERALVMAREWPSPPRSFKPLVTVLQRWAKEGGPPDLGKSPDFATRANPAGRPIKSVFGNRTPAEVAAELAAALRDRKQRSVGG